MIPKLLIKTIKFLGDNLLGIVLVSCLFAAIAVLIVVNNITFPKKKKTKVDRVIVIEKMTSQNDFVANAYNGLQTDKTLQLDTRRLLFLELVFGQLLLIKMKKLINVSPRLVYESIR